MVAPVFWDILRYIQHNRNATSALKLPVPPQHSSPPLFPEPAALSVQRTLGYHSLPNAWPCPRILACSGRLFPLQPDSAKSTWPAIRCKIPLGSIGLWYPQFWFPLALLLRMKIPYYYPQLHSRSLERFGLAKSNSGLIRLRVPVWPRNVLRIGLLNRSELFCIVPMARCDKGKQGKHSAHDSISASSVKSGILRGTVMIDQTTVWRHPPSKLLHPQINSPRS